jgi:predicted dienelactone hydrolase
MNHQNTKIALAGVATPLVATAPFFAACGGPSKRAATARRLAAMALALLAFGAACSSGGSSSKTPTATPALDPAGTGTYGVGTTSMTFTRQTADGPRALRTLFWYPTGAAADAAPQADAAPANGQFPIVIVSHGARVEPQYFQYLTQHLASWGFVVAAPEHNPSNTSADCPVFPCDQDAWSASLAARVDDVPFVLDQVIALMGDPSQPLGSVIDARRTAIVGNSLGGSMAIPKANSFGAAIFLAPAPGGTLLGAAGSVRVPTLIIAGGKDDQVPVGDIDAFYAALPPDIAKTYVKLAEGHHGSFIDSCAVPFLGVTATATCTEVLLPLPRGHDLINHYVTAFLETRLVGDDRYAHFLSESEPPDAEVAAR